MLTPPSRQPVQSVRLSRPNHLPDRPRVLCIPIHVTPDRRVIPTTLQSAAGAENGVQKEKRERGARELTYVVWHADYPDRRITRIDIRAIPFITIIPAIHVVHQLKRRRAGRRLRRADTTRLSFSPLSCDAHRLPDHDAAIFTLQAFLPPSGADAMRPCAAAAYQSETRAHHIADQ
jgi:hypothetical protein